LPVDLSRTVSEECSLSAVAGTEKPKDWHEFQDLLFSFDPLEIISHLALECWRSVDADHFESQLSPACLEYSAGIYVKKPLRGGRQPDVDDIRQLKEAFLSIATEEVDANPRRLEGKSQKDKTREATVFTALYYQIVRGDAYPAQLKRATIEQFNAHDEVLKKILGLDTETIVSIFQWLADLIETNVQSYFEDFRSLLEDTNRRLVQARFGNKAPPDHKMPIEEIMEDDTFRRQLDDHNARARNVFMVPKSNLEKTFGLTESNAFLKRFSTEFGAINEHFDKGSDYNQLNERPIINLPNQTLFIPVPLLLSHVPVRTLHYDLTKFQDYRPTYDRIRGEYNEDRTSHFLSKIFGSAQVRKNLTFGGKNKKGEIDVLVVFDNKLIIIQCKSKALTLPAKQGSTESILTDFSKAIQAAYLQGKLARSHILSNDLTIFTDSAGKELVISRNDVNEIFLVCITSETFAYLATDLSLLLEKAPTDPFPWVASLFDLELVSEYIPDPYQFLHFLTRRQAAYGKVLSPDEMEFVGCYLKQGLWFGDGVTKRFQRVIIDGYTKDFDIDQYRKQKGLTSSKVGSSWSNPSFSNLLGTLRILNDKGHSDMILTLLDLGTADRDRLIHLIEETIKKTLSDKTHHDFTLLYDEFGISFVANYGRPGLREINIGMSTAKQYKHKKKRWFGLGRDVTDSDFLVNEFCFIEQPWKHDKNLERIAGKLRGTALRV